MFHAWKTNRFWGRHCTSFPIYDDLLSYQGILILTKDRLQNLKLQTALRYANH
jgi:hypothetical protein